MAEIKRLMGNRLTPDECEKLTEAVVRVVQEYSRTVASSALEAAKKKIVETDGDKTG